MKKPFGIVSGEGLGLINTTHQLLNDSPLAATTFGQAPVKSYANIASGNLVVQTPTVKIDELGGALEFFWTYNSQAADAQKWHFNWQKQLLNANSANDTFQLVEADGHVTTYKKDSQRGNQYFSQNVGEGTPFMRFDDIKKCWRKYDPKTHITEYYDSNGRLISREDLAGHLTTFNYDNQGRLIKINAPSGACYTLDWSANGVVLSCVENNNTTILRLYGLDGQGRLVEETYPKSNYKINYGYANTSTQLATIAQTDNTTIGFMYDAPTQQGKVNVLQYGTVNRNTLDYSKSPTVTLLDNYRNQTQFTLNNQNLIEQIKTQTGYSGVNPINQFDVTQFTYQNGSYDPNNITLAKITQPDGSNINYQYDPVYNLKTVKTGPGNQKHAWFYQQGGDRPLLISQADYLDPYDEKSALTTRYVYDTNYDGQGHAALRYQISPAGCVTENRFDTTWRTLVSKRRYLAQLFDLSHYPNPQSVPAYQAMEIWRNDPSQNPAQVSLNDYTRNARGQITLEKNYTAVDAKGNGIENNTMAKTLRGWDLYGNCCLETERQDADVTATTQHSFDDLRREILRIDPLKRQWEWQYQDKEQQVTTKQPNGREDILPWDAQGLTTHQAATVMKDAQEQVRLTQQRRDHNGNLIITIPPTLQTQEGNLPREHQFYDRQYRLGFKVSRSGRVQETRFDAVHRVTYEIKYANSIDIKQLYLTWPPLPTDLPNVSRLIKQLPADPGVNDQVIIKCTSPSGKLRYTVDGEGYLTEIRYDNLDHPVATIQYEMPVSDVELQQLLNGQTLNRIPDPNIDSINRTFYGADHEIIATQDAKGYVTEYFYNAGKQKIKSKIYDSKALIDLSITDFNKVRPAPSLKDAITYYWYDNKGNEIANVNAENILTTKAYYANGKLRQSRKYINEVTVNDGQMPIGVQSDQDEIYNYTYDLAKREIQVDKPYGETQLTQYDVSDNKTLSKIFDRLNPDLVTPNYQQNTQAIFDGWNQPVQKANVFVGQLLADIDADPNLTPEQKSAEKQLVWQQKAAQQHYDETGLHLWTRNPIGGVTYFYYDQDERPIYKIKPNGAIEQTVYDAFNNPIATYLFATQIPAEKLNTLTGGFLTDDFKAYLDGLRDKTKDRITVNQYDRRNLKTQTLDPEGFISTFKFNHQRKCILEQLPVKDNNSLLTIKHQYDPRGAETKTTKTDGTNTSITAHEYENPLGKETAFINELGGRTQKERDRLGRLVKQTNPLGIVDFERIIDAFNRIKQEKDADGNITQHQYNQQTRSHVIQTPVPGYTKTEIQDVFKRTLQRFVADNKPTLFTHAPHGEVHTQTDPLNNITTTDFNLMGLPETITHPNGSVDANAYNTTGQLTQKCVDKHGLALTTNYQPNAFGENEQINDPKNIVTQNQFNRNGLNTNTIIDPDKLKLSITREFNGQKTQVAENHGDTDNPNQYQETYQKDGLNRDTGKTIAPGTLNIQTQKELNVAGLIKAEKDANGNTTYHFYNKLKQKRFSVDPEGGITEWVYDQVGNDRVHCERHLTHGFDFSKNDISKITLEELNNLVVRDDSDKQLWTFRDAAGREQFHINSQGRVTETVYDDASNPSKTIIYSVVIDPKTLSTLQTIDIANWTREHQNDSLNRISYHLFDDAKQERYVINPRGYIVEKIYKNKKLIAEIKYATKLDNPQQIANLPVDQVDNAIIKDQANDRETWHIFDATGCPWFTVTKIDKNKAAVTRFDHDKNGNLEQTCNFGTALDWPVEDYETLTALCLSLTPDPKIDQILKSEHDNADREVKKTNAMGNSQQFVLDSIGNQKALLDEINNQFNFDFDDAKRRTNKTLPPCDITLVQQANNDPHWCLQSTVQEGMQIKQHRDFDPAGNVTQIIRAQGTSEERSVQLGYNKCNKPSTVTVTGVALDDPNQNASWQTRPEKTNQTLTKQMVYDYRGRKVAEKGYDDQWTLFIYDSEDREIYRILPRNIIIGKNYNTFGDQITETQYDSRLTFDLAPYIQKIIQTKTALPLSVLTPANGFKPSPDDRTTSYEHNAEGKIITIKKPEGPYFLSNDQDGQYGVASAVEKRDYNAFNELIFEAELVDPQQNILKRKITWFDPCGKKSRNLWF
jgi:YD repeat-containing protein